MNRKVVTISGEASLEDAARLMVQNRISGLPVVNDQGTVTGLITEGDLLRRPEIGTAPHASWLATFLSAGQVAQDYVRSHARKVDELISGDVISVMPDASLAEVVAIMESRQVKRVPVIEDGQLVGIIARADLVGALMKMLPGGSEGLAVTDAQVRVRFLREVDAQKWGSRVAVECAVKSGVIELRGLITNERMRAALRVIAENTEGARGIRDHLLCIEPISGTVISQGSDDKRTVA